MGRRPVRCSECGQQGTHPLVRHAPCSELAYVRRDDDGRPRFVVVPCGAGKLAELPDGRPVPARQLYTGAHFRLGIEAADALGAALNARVVILSALYGLVPADRGASALYPYNVTMGDPGAVQPAELRRQAGDLGMARPGAYVLALLPRRYLAAIRPELWAAGATVVDGFGQLHSADGTTLPACRGIGHQRQRLAQLRDEARADAERQVLDLADAIARGAL